MSAIGGSSGPGPYEYGDDAPPADAAQADAPSADATAKAEHPLVERAGRALGLGIGVVVTEGLRLVPGWNRPVLGADGKPVASVPGAARDGDYEIRKRHEEVVGPEVTAKAEKLGPGLLRDFVAGFGAGATEAPGASYRLDARIDDALHPKKTDE
jgi:hypothetical protein